MQENKAEIKPEWIDRIFLRMEQKFGERWKQKFLTKEKEALAKREWKNALHGCTIDQIQRALLACDILAAPPLWVEFYAFCKEPGFSSMAKSREAISQERRDKGREQLALIKQKLR